MDKKKAEAEYDRVFSLAVRKKAADENGYVACCTCSRRLHYTRMTCGHFRKRRHLSTRWLFLNCAPQCQYCNGNESKTDIIFEKYLEENRGEGTVNKLIVLSHQYKSYTVQEIISMIELIKQEYNI